MADVDPTPTTVRAALADQARQRRAYGRLPTATILQTCWLAAARIAQRDPDRGRRIMRALLMIDLATGPPQPAQRNRQAFGVAIPWAWDCGAVYERHDD